MLHWFRGDLHIHTVLSACADLSMGPRDIVASALAKGLDFIAVTDHNSAANVAAVYNAAKGTSLTVIPGIEVSTREEIHMVCLLPNLDRASSFQDYLYEYLQQGWYDGSILGSQIICDENENIIAEDNHLLALPIRVSYDQLAFEAQKMGGIIYPAHIDRKVNGILRILGFLPKHLPFNIVEVSRTIDPIKATERFGQNGELSVITSSDAHDIGQIGIASTYFLMTAPTFSEISMAFNRKNGRTISMVPPQ